MTRPPSADERACLATAWERAASLAERSAPPLLELLADAPAPPGYAVWRLGGEGGPLTALPALRGGPAVPYDVRRRYLSRVLATCSGRCPLCSAVAEAPTAGPDPERAGAGWAAAAVAVAVGLTHQAGCRATFTEADRRWFDPRAVGGEG